MSDSGVAAEVRGVLATVLAGAGGLLLRDLWKWAKRRRAEKRLRSELLDVIADAVQLQLDEARALESMRQTGRIRVVSPEEIAEQHGAHVSRRQEIARRLREARGQDERRGQDMFADDGTEADER